jgi:hypothetical protein
MQPICKEWIGKHIPAATNMHATIEKPVSKQRIGKYNNRGCWKWCFLFGPCKVVITESSVQKS